jgi:hypothetical protein
MVDISQRVPSPLGKVPSECEADEVSLGQYAIALPKRGRECLDSCSVKNHSALVAGTENRAADADVGGTLGDGFGEVAAHAHGEFAEAV